MEGENLFAEMIAGNHIIEEGEYATKMHECMYMCMVEQVNYASGASNKLEEKVVFQRGGIGGEGIGAICVHGNNEILSDSPKSATCSFYSLSIIIVITTKIRIESRQKIVFVLMGQISRVG